MSAQDPQLAIVQVNDSVPGTVPRITGPGLALVSDGSGSAAIWAAAGGSTRLLTGAVYVDPTFAGTPDGSQNAPYPSMAAALDATSGDITLLMVPGSYSEADLTLPVGRQVFLNSVIEAGTSVFLENKIIFPIENSSGFGAHNVAFQEIGLKDADSGTGTAFLLFSDCLVSSFVNENTAGAAYSHHHQITFTGSHLTPHYPDVSDYASSILAHASAIKGTIDAVNTQFNGDIVGATILRLRNCSIQHNQTALGQVIALGTYFLDGLTLAQGAGANFYVDRLSKYYLNACTVTGGTITLLD